jgi:CheY-like chemotaxis protein/CHASE3 domain sensor protein
MKSTLSQKIQAGFILSTLILIVAAVLSFRNSEKFNATNQMVKHTQEVLYEFEQVLVSCVNAETGERGYIITGAENYLEPYNKAKNELFVHIRKIKNLTTDNQEQQKNISVIDEKITAFMDRMQYCIDIRRNQGFQKAQEVILSNTGKKMLDEIRVLIDNGMNIELTLLNERKKVNDEDADNFNTIFIVLLLIIAIILISVYAIITLNLRALKKAEQETADRNWTLLGSSELAKNMQGNLQINDLGRAIINFLCNYLGAQVGALYLINETTEQLVLTSSYSVNNGKREKSIMNPGEGIAGQALSENKMIQLRDIPESDFDIASSFGKIKPKYIIAIPFLFESLPTGVIELGSIRELSTLKKEYLQLVMDNIAIAFVSAQSRDQTRELLEETQAQAEELEVQQEELKNANEELHRKTELLEESETELKAQQQDLEQINEELELKANILEEQKNKLETAKAEIENKAKEVEEISKYKSEFLANMSHELRTPLNSVLILSQLLSENKHGNLGAKEIEFSKNIYTSGNDLLNLINEILDLSKIESGKMELDLSEVSLQDIVNDISFMFTELAKSKSISFTINFAGTSQQAVIKTDKQRVEQIIKNLLSNAIKFTGKGGAVTLTIDYKATAATLFNRHLTSSHVVSFSVSDTGIGIPESKRAIIFEAFQQADGSTKRKYGGTGLGLSISKELANVLGGQIQLESTEGKGSTFTLYLPARFNSLPGTSNKQTDVKENTLTEPVIATGPAGTLVPHEQPVFDDRLNISENDKVILIIEDDGVFAQTLLGFIRGRNYKGIISHQGNTAVSFARHYKPDAIMLDIQLPVMDGVEVLKQLKNDPDLRHIPVQIISGHDKRKEGYELGAFDYIKKPITLPVLQSAFDKVERFIQKKLKKVLIVEDNETQNNAIRELIGNGDVKCFSAYKGNEAYSMLLNDDFDCIIVDLNLPDMSGFDLLDKIKANEKVNTIPVVVYTGVDLSKEEKVRLEKVSSTVILKTVDSHERLLDETILFLHKVESKLPKEKQNLIRKLHKADEVLKGKKVLLVDDDMRNIYSLLNVLEEEGVQCVVAENGKEALVQLTENPDVDLVLMDIMMPEMDGYEATMQIRATGVHSKLPIIALTAKAMKGDREKCLAAGMSDYISKPVNVSQLLSLMRVWLYK